MIEKCQQRHGYVAPSIDNGIYSVVGKNFRTVYAKCREKRNDLGSTYLEKLDSKPSESSSRTD